MECLQDDYTKIWSSNGFALYLLAARHLYQSVLILIQYRGLEALSGLTFARVNDEVCLDFCSDRLEGLCWHLVLPPVRKTALSQVELEAINWGKMRSACGGVETLCYKNLWPCQFFAPHSPQGLRGKLASTLEGRVENPCERGCLPHS